MDKWYLGRSSAGRVYVEFVDGPQLKLTTKKEVNTIYLDPKMFHTLVKHAEVECFHAKGH